MIARAIQTAEPFVINDATSTTARMMKVTPSETTRSLTVLPLVVDGKAVGVFVLNSLIPGFFDAEEMRLLQELAGDISFAMTHLRQAEQVHYLANFDALTGLPNRLLFAEQLLFQIQTPSHEMLAVILVDLERFRGVNATLGRAAGDQLLKQVAQRLKQVNPSVACLGADLFAVTVEHRSVAEIARAQEEIGKRCFGEPFIISGQELRIGFCCGVAVFPGDGDEAEALLRNAETALRRAKAATAACVFYAPEMNNEASRALVIESKLRRAIEREEFILYYQPKVSVADNRIAGFEALIRWRDPEAGLVSPGEFIPVLEETGLIGQVGQWALRQAMADHARWRELGLAPPRLAVNVSPMQLHQGDFVARVADAIAVEGAEALELEITESLIMDNVATNAAMLAEIRKLDVTTTIDDFGTGYCSLAYIAKLPVTALKIDRTFILDMTEGPEGMAIVSSIIGLAHALRLKVVAEGIETEEQARLLRLLGCDMIQGFLYSRPVPPDEVPALLRAGTLTAQVAH
jgi:diguanylate cyclase (GGDEF)-like protein